MEILTTPFTDTEAKDELKKYKEQQEKADNEVTPTYFPSLDIYTHSENPASMFKEFDIPECWNDDPAVMQETKDEIDRLRLYMEQSVQAIQMELIGLKGLVKRNHEDLALIRNSLQLMLEIMKRRTGEA